MIQKISASNYENALNSFSMQYQQDKNNQFQSFNHPPPVFSIPDLSRPPPTFVGLNNTLLSGNSSPQLEEIDEKNPLPFFMLPAGLMVSLIGLESFRYHSLDSELVTLPPPTSSNEKLLSAVEAYYSAPSHERPRDTEGWEKSTGLYEYFKIKNSVRKQKEEAIIAGERQMSKSPSPGLSTIRQSKKQKRRVYQSRTPEPRSSRSKSRSVSPECKLAGSVLAKRFRSRKKSRSPSPYRAFNRELRAEKRKRSLTPPCFIDSSTKSINEFISEGNKGHQMLKKLGWTSGGLGVGKKPGINVPISSGELRNKSDLYKVTLYFDISVNKLCLLVFVDTQT